MSVLKKLIPTAWHYPLSNLKRKFTGYKKFSQFGEDLVLLKLFKEKNNGIYVDVGAHHPYRYSNTYLLHKKGWRGVNIDPNPHTIELFEKARPNDQNICCGVGMPATLTYFQFSDPAVNTFVAAQAQKWKEKAFLTFLGTRDVSVRPLSELIRGPIDLLTIDVEGMDLEVLQSYGWKQYPTVIIVEGDESTEFLTQKGYKLYAQRGVSNIFSHT